MSKTLNTALCYANIAHSTLGYCWQLPPAQVPVTLTLGHATQRACGSRAPHFCQWTVLGLWLQIPKDPKDLQCPQVQFVLQKGLCMSVPPVYLLQSGKMNAEAPHGRLGSLLHFYVTYYKNPK